MAKTTRKKTARKKVAKRPRKKPVRGAKKIVRKKTGAVKKKARATKRTVARKSGSAAKRTVRPKRKAARKKTSRTAPSAVGRMMTQARQGKIPSAAKVAVGAVYDFNDDLAWNIKQMLNKYVRLVTRHTGYYRDVKRWTDATIDRIVELGYELEAAHREYLKLAKRYIRKLGKM